jgi:hypothetical protein
MPANKCKKKMKRTHLMDAVHFVWQNNTYFYTKAHGIRDL